MGLRRSVQVLVFSIVASVTAARERLCCLTSTEARRPVRDGDEGWGGEGRIGERGIEE